MVMGRVHGSLRAPSVKRGTVRGASGETALKVAYQEIPSEYEGVPRHSQ